MGTAEQSLVNVLNTYVVTVCLVMKSPQVYNIVTSSSAKSLSLSSVLLEFYAYSCSLIYPIAKGHPVGTFLEFVFLYLQDVLLIVLIIYHRKLFSVKLVVTLPLYLACVYSVLSGIAPDSILVFLVRSIAPVITCSRFFQWYAIYQAQDSGQVSPVTWGLSVTTSLSRFATNLLVVHDFSMMTNQLLAASLALAMMLTVLYYRKEDKKKTN